MGTAHSSEPALGPPLDPEAHLQLFNLEPTSSSATSNPAFHLFPLLPTELRLMIWKCSLQRRRIIRINTRNYTFHPDVKEADKPEANDHHFPIVEGYQCLSKLLRVNRESRQAAQEFYRVHIPCRLLLDGKELSDRPVTETTRPGTFYFNPEYDFLLLYSDPLVTETLLEFIHRLKRVHDPRGVGLLNLAADQNTLSQVREYRPDQIDPEVNQSFVETLAQLRTFYSVVHVATGRQCEGWRSGYSGDVFFNRSMPILGSAPTFEVLPRDPRLITEDLRKVYTGLYSQWPYQILQGIFETWAVKARDDIEYRLLLGFRPVERVHDYDSAKRWVRKEDEHWKWCAKGGPAPNAREGSFAAMDWPPLKIPKENLQRVPRPAVGFWLFPVEVMTEGGVGRDAVGDLSGYWPELALTSLP